MSDNITLPREVAKLALDHIEWYIENERGGRFAEVREAAEALRAALAAPEPEPVAWMESPHGVIRANPDYRFNFPSQILHWQIPLYTPPPAPRPEPVRHPGYIIGSHWLETAYERLCAGEAEDAILEDYELVREPRLRELRRDAERYRWLLNWLVKTGLLSRERCRIDSPASYGDWWILRKPKVIDGSALIGYGETEDAAIDAAMEPATEPAIRARGEVPR